MIKIIKINNGGPLIIGPVKHLDDTYEIECAVSIIQEDGIMRMVDLLPFSDFQKGISFPATSIEFTSIPTEDLMVEYDDFCDDIINGKVEVKGKPQLLVEGNDTTQ